MNSQDFFANLEKSSTVVATTVYSIAVLVVCIAAGDRFCGPKHLPTNYPNISFFPMAGILNPHQIKCFWEIYPPESDDFVLTLTFLFLSGYESDDDIGLPDGKSIVLYYSLNSLFYTSDIGVCSCGATFGPL